ncbi:MAG: SRPBCC family protein [Ignavibacteriae bacterium]|nr:SRPBCC family protein [Ignavibacteriota bacterium]
MHKLEKKQRLPIDIKTAWEFFSSPKNLSKITPSYMGFNITSELKNEKMYPGLFITYRVRPVLGIPITWVTEITEVSEGNYFIDEQRVGPYKIWHHEHHFRECEGGTEMTDLLYYRLPFWFLGKILHSLFVKRKVISIFDYRTEVLEKLFK